MEEMHYEVKHFCLVQAAFIIAAENKSLAELMFYILSYWHLRDMMLLAGFLCT